MWGLLGHQSIASQAVQMPDLCQSVLHCVHHRRCVVFGGSTYMQVLSLKDDGSTYMQITLYTGIYSSGYSTARFWPASLHTVPGNCFWTGLDLCSVQLMPYVSSCHIGKWQSFNHSQYVSINELWMQIAINLQLQHSWSDLATVTDYRRTSPRSIPAVQVIGASC